MDGEAYTRTEDGNNAKIVFQVKSGHVKPGDIDALWGVMSKVGAEMSVFITLKEPTARMKDAARLSGVWKHPLMPQSYPRVRIVTIREILKGDRLSLPLPVEVLKKAAMAKQAGDQLPLNIGDDVAEEINED